MTDYKQMYVELFHAVTKAIDMTGEVLDTLKKAQEIAEEIHISTEQEPKKIIPFPDQDE